MAALGPAFVFTPPDYDARLVPYAAVLAAAGFVLDTERPFDNLGVGGDWESPDGWTFRASLSVAGERRPMLGSLVRITPQRVQWLFDCFQLDTPADLEFLLAHCTSLADARQRTAHSVAARLYSSGSTTASKRCNSACAQGHSSLASGP